ncbi:MAG: putative toxin-antitoxin system toxin component, PIN family [Nitrososphaerales archaeon]
MSAVVSKDGTCADVLDLVTTFDEIELVLSKELLSEFAEVVGRDEVRGRLGHGDADKFKKAITDVATVIEVKSNLEVVHGDPDDMVVNTALDGKAQHVVSGDRHPTRLKRVEGARIVTPNALLRISTRRFGELIPATKGEEGGREDRLIPCKDGESGGRRAR